MGPIKAQAWRHQSEPECITECPACPAVGLDSEMEGWGGSVGVMLFVAFCFGYMMG